MAPPEGGESYELVAPPIGATVPYLPDDAKRTVVDGKTYYLHADTWYKPYIGDGDVIYQVIEDPRKN